MGRECERYCRGEERWVESVRAREWALSWLANCYSIHAWSLCLLCNIFTPMYISMRGGGCVWILLTVLVVFSFYQCFMDPFYQCLGRGGGSVQCALCAICTAYLQYWWYYYLSISALRTLHLSQTFDLKKDLCKRKLKII